MPSIRKTLINDSFARLWFGQAVSTVGNFVFDTTLVLWVATKLGYHKPWAPAAVSGVLLAALVSAIVVGPLAGVFVDRWDRRRTMLATEVVRGIVVGVLTVLSVLPVHTLPIWLWLGIIYTVVIIVNGAGMLFSPARFAVIGDVVPGEADRARAAGITEATAATAAIIGPPLAAPLLVTAGLQWGLLVNALTFVVSYIAISSVRIPPRPAREAGGAEPESGYWNEFRAGLRFFRRSRYLVALGIMAVIAQFGTGALNALDVFFVTGNLHASSKLYGVMSTAFGLGSVAGALLAGLLVKRIGARRAAWITMVAAGAIVAVYSRQTMFVTGLIALVFLGLTVTLLNTAISPLLLAVTPREYLGRVIAIFVPANGMSSMLSAVVAGWLASTAFRRFHADVGGVHLGPIDSIFGAAGIMLVAAGVFGAFSLPRTRPEEAAAAPEEAMAGGAAAVPAQVAHDAGSEPVIPALVTPDIVSDGTASADLTG